MRQTRGFIRPRIKSGVTEFLNINNVLNLRFHPLLVIPASCLLANNKSGDLTRLSQILLMAVLAHSNSDYAFQSNYLSRRASIFLAVFQRSVSYTHLTLPTTPYV